MTAEDPRPAPPSGPAPLPTRADAALDRIAELVAESPEPLSGDEGYILDDVRRIVEEARGPRSAAFDSPGREARIADVLVDYPGAEVDDADDALRRFLLVERNLKDSPPFWVTTHDTPEEASAYHHGQEYAHDWQVETLVDLDTGRHWVATETVTRFTPSTS